MPEKVKMLVERFESAERDLYELLTGTLNSFKTFQAEVADMKPLAEQAGHVVAVLKAFRDSMDLQ